MTEAVVALIGLITSLFKAIKFIHEGEKGVRLRFGKAKRDMGGKIIVSEPGFILMIPFVDTLKRHHVRQQSQTFADQRIILKDGLVYKVGAVVIYRVTDITKALFEIDDLDGSMQDACSISLREVVQSKKHEDLSDIGKVNEELRLHVQNRVNDWGIEIIKFGMSDCAPTTETASIINAEIMVAKRADALEKVQQNILKLQIDPALAAALVGIPLATTLVAEKVHPAPRRDEGEGKFNVTLFGGGKKDAEEV